ncbi:DNA repair protein RadC [bacterium]|nr:DNA repair protein RadC [bacterium]
MTGRGPNVGRDGSSADDDARDRAADASRQGASTDRGKTPTRHFHGHRERLRARVLGAGGESMADYELLETLLGAFIPRRDVKPIAKALLERFGGVSGVFAAHPERLMEIDGVGEVAAAYIRTTHVLFQRAAGDAVRDRPVISNWAALLAYVRMVLRHAPAEQFRVLFLDRKNQLISDEVLGRGTVDHAPVYPREIARRALELSASSVILVHNHPSGDATPSRADVEITREVIKALAALDINLHDHLIVGRSEPLSMKAKGLI